jgi:thioredoxin-like negative regulator of GroEL
VRVLVLSEDWCGDCTDNLPIINRIAEESGKLDVRIVSRDAHPEIMDGYLKYGRFRAIPLMLFLSADGQVIGHFTERPESVTELRARKKQEIYEQHPEFGAPEAYATLPEETRAALSDALLAMRDETRPFAIGEVVRELGEIAAQVAV